MSAEKLAKELFEAYEEKELLEKKITGIKNALATELMKSGAIVSQDSKLCGLVKINTDKGEKTYKCEVEFDFYEPHGEEDEEDNWTYLW